jgi:hypothetical protein
MSKKKPAKNLTTKKIAKSRKPKSKTDSEVQKFWDKFENDLYNNTSSSKKFHDLPLHNQAVCFDGQFKSLIKKTADETQFDSIDLLEDSTPWYSKAWSKFVSYYDQIRDYAWNNPFKSFFIAVGVVFTIATVSSCVHKYI